MASTFGSNFEGICQFRTLTKNTATQVFGTAEDLLIDPVKGLAHGECTYRDPAAGEDCPPWQELSVRPAECE
jgi:hypothetical protein